MLVLSACGASVDEDATAVLVQPIVGGTQATPGEYPWQARLSITIAGQGYLCGGSLIATDWVLTAAHCLSDNAGNLAQSVSVVLGDHNAAIAEASEQTRSAARYVQHPGYDRATSANDIALIQLSSPVQLGERVRTIPLASESYGAGTNTTATGWGLIGTSPVWVDAVGGALWVYPDGTPVLNVTRTNTLMEVSTPVVSTATCQDAYSTTIQDSMLCAGVPGALPWENGRGTCSGDSGGPLVVKTPDGVSRLAGVTSFGNAFCSSYSVFTRVSSFAPWIQAVQYAATRKGLTWGKFTADDAYLDPLSTRGLDRVGCYGQPLVNGSPCNAYQGDTACTESRRVLCVKVDGSPRPAYKMFGWEYYNGWANGQLGATAPISGLLLTSRAAGDQACARALGTGWKMVEHHDGKYITGMSETAYYGSQWTAAAASQKSGGWNVFGHSNLPATGRFWVAINDQSANCWGR